MGKYTKGILDKFSGKVGTVIGSKWKGIHYMRSLSTPTSIPPTEAQLRHRAKFRRTIKFLQPLHPILRIGFATQIKKKSAINAALADTISTAIGDDYPDFSIDYARFMVAKGILGGAQNAVVSVNETEISFTWDDNSGNGLASNTDKALLVALGEDIYPSWSLGSFTRLATSGTLPLPHGKTGTPYSCYLAFVSADNKEVSNSLYLGSFTL